MEHFLKENAAIALQILYALFFSFKTTKTFIAFLISYTNLKYTNMKGAKRKATTNTCGIWIYEEINS